MFIYCQHGSSSIDNDTFLRTTCRVSLPSHEIPEYLCSSSISRIRTFLSIRTSLRTRRYMNHDGVSGIIPQCKLVRMLRTVEWSSSAVRISFRLNNLRYLHLYTKARRESSLMVPKSISNQRNLETLNVDGDHSIYDQKYVIFFPVEIWEMPRLRNLVSEILMHMTPFPASDVGDSSIECSSLRALTGIVNFDDFTPSVIQKLQNLKKLQIKYEKLSRNDEEKEFCLDNLVNLHHLEDLTISCRGFSGPRVTNIGFPRNLKKLRLRDTRLPWENMTSVGDLIHLEVLKLYGVAFAGQVWEPIEGQFLQLKYLKMELLWDLKEWRVESTHFPSLEKLVILNCRMLKEVPTDIGEIDTLQKLIVQKSRNNSVGRGFEDSVRSIQEEQQSVCNDALQVIIMSEYQYLRYVDT